MLSEPDTSPLGDLDMGAHFVLVAAPRSGTTWLKEMLNLHPEVYCSELRLFGEAEMLSYDHVNNPQRPNIRLTLDKYAAKLAHTMTPVQPQMSKDQMHSLLQRVLVRALAGMVRRNVDKPVLVDKVTPYQGRERATIEAYQRWFPTARFIFLVRDGRDVAVSGMYHWYKRRLQIEPTALELTRAGIIEGEKMDASLRSAFRPGELQAWAQSWAEIANLEAQTSEYTLRYEQMLDDNGASLAELLRRFGVRANEDVVSPCLNGARFEVMSGGRQRGQDLPGAHVRRGVPGDWRHVMTRGDGEVFHQIASAQMARLGYAKDGSWIEQLSDVFKSG